MNPDRSAAVARPLQRRRYRAPADPCHCQCLCSRRSAGYDDLKLGGRLVLDHLTNVRAASARRRARARRFELCRERDISENAAGSSWRHTERDSALIAGPTQNGRRRLAAVGPPCRARANGSIRGRVDACPRCYEREKRPDVRGQA